MNTKPQPKSVRSIAGGANGVQPIVQQAQPNVIRRLLDGIIENKSRILFFSWLLALCCVFAMQQNMQNTASQFFGLTGSREQAISFQHSVEITRINVVEGEKVKQNTKLLEAFRYDLAVKQSIIDENITEIKTRLNQSTETTDAKLHSLIAERKAKVAEITTRINKLESRYKLSRKLLKDISGTDHPEHHSVESPLLAEIKGLKTARGHMKKQLEAQIRNLEKQLENRIALSPELSPPLPPDKRFSRIRRPHEFTLSGTSEQLQLKLFWPKYRSEAIQAHSLKLRFSGTTFT